jgi:hypothetical protein
VCETESLVGKVIKCVWLHHREVMCMAEASNEGEGYEREEAHKEEREGVCA